ncbi:MAG: tetratricopeptide repeat protein [Geminicoccaceae bacterium]|nr:tetratricopeptide repeat protein [Geminicoccaceae bacterium]
MQDAFRRAVDLHAAGRVREAEAVYRRLLGEAKGPQPRLTARLAQARLDRGDAQEAARLTAEALKHQDGDPFIHQLHGVALRRTGRLEEARAALERAAGLAPDDPAILHSLGKAFADLGRHAEAEAALRRSLDRDPSAVGTLTTLSLVLRHAARPAEALDAVGRALALDPGHAGARLERGMTLLALGRYEEGFEDYEARFSTEGNAPPDLPGRAWRGGPLAGETVLLWCEQGLGDMIQFARFAPLVVARGAAKVLLLMRPPLVRLLRTLQAPGVEVVPEGAAGLAYDLHAPLMSVPGLLGLGLDGVPAAVPYLFPEPERVARWRGALRPGGPREGGFMVGVAWQGKPTSKADIGRSFPLRHVEPLARLPGLRLVALQKEHGLDQLGRLPPGVAVETLGEAFDAGPDAFLDTAAVMASLDLVITSDTAVAHLAGALGRPVWVVLRYGAEWRWLQARDDSPWYPTMRLFRQDAPGDWAGAFARVEAALRGLLAERRLPSARPTIPVSWGELIDKIAILEIKAERIGEPAKLANVRAELLALEAVRDKAAWRTPETRRLAAVLKAVNEELWAVEDDIRGCERAGDFGPRFVGLARSVYVTNDRRAALKRALNEALGSTLVEEKSYADYSK